MDTIPTIIKLNNQNIITTYNLKDYIQKHLDKFNSKPQPFRLVMIKASENCQFCENPEGGVYCHLICHYNDYGFVSCKECYSKGQLRKNEWLNEEAFGRARHLKDLDIKVMRSSGQIESGWKLNHFQPMVEFINGEDCVSCINETAKISRFCSIDNLLDLNPQTNEINNLMEQIKNTKL